jgi:hypothetical protein
VILLFEQSIPCWCCYDLLLLVASTTTTYSEMLTGQLGARGTIPVPSCHFHAAVPCGNRKRRSGPRTLDNDTTATGSAQEKTGTSGVDDNNIEPPSRTRPMPCSMRHVDFVCTGSPLALLLQNHHDVGLLVFYGMGSSTVAQGPLTVLPGRRSRRQNDVTTTTPHQNYPGRTAPRAGTRQRSIRRRRRALRRRIRNTDRARIYLFLRRNTWTANASATVTGSRPERWHALVELGGVVEIHAHRGLRYAFVENAVAGQAGAFRRCGPSRVARRPNRACRAAFRRPTSKSPAAFHVQHGPRSRPPHAQTSLGNYGRILPTHGQAVELGRVSRPGPLPSNPPRCSYGHSRHDTRSEMTPLTM